MKLKLLLLVTLFTLFSGGCRRGKRHGSPCKVHGQCASGLCLKGECVGIEILLKPRARNPRPALSHRTAMKRPARRIFFQMPATGRPSQRANNRPAPGKPPARRASEKRAPGENPPLTGKLLWAHDGHTGAPVAWGKKIVAAAQPGKLIILAAHDGRKLMTHELKKRLLAPPVISEEMAMLQTAERELMALELQTGKVMWALNAGSPVNPPAADRTAVYTTTLSQKGNLQIERRALKTSALIWRRPLGQPLSARAAFSHRPIIITRDVVYAGLPDGYVYALNAGDGRIRWTFWAGVRPDNPVLGRRQVFVALRRKAGAEVIALERLSGRVRWRRPISGGISSSLACSHGRVVLHTGQGKLTALNEKTGATVWTVPQREPIVGAPAIEGGKVTCIVKGKKGDLLRLWDLRQGDLLFSRPLKGRATGSPLFLKGLILVGGEGLRTFQ